MNEKVIKNYAKETYQFVTELILSPLQTIQMAISELIYLGIMLWISVLILKKNEIVIDERELAQVWLKGAILGCILSVGLSAIRISTFFVLGAFTTLIPVALIAGSTYIYLYKTKSIGKEKARTVSIIIGIVLCLLPLGSYSSMYWLF